MRRTRAVLIVGGSGFIGSHLAATLREGYKVFATFTSHPMRMKGVSYIPFNAFDRDWMKRVMFRISPDVIFYMAGTDSVSWSEKNPRDSERIHVSGAATVLTAAEILQPKFIYLSNSYVFDGNKGNYHESDVVLPATNLGKSKVGGENFVRGRSINYIVVRPSPVYGRGNGKHFSFLDQLRFNLELGRRVEMPTDELHSFCPVYGLTSFLARLVESGPRNSILHYGGLTKVTYYEFARRYAMRFGYDASLVVPMAAPAQEADFSLNTSFVSNGLKIQPLLLEEGFDLLEKKLAGHA